MTPGARRTETLRPDADIWGRILRAQMQGGEVRYRVLREDGARFGDSAAYYLAPYPAWLACERRVVAFVDGPALDLGCGAGRVALHLQERGVEVVGVDRSPGALAVARRRGLKAAHLAEAGRDPLPPGRFRTAVLLGNNLGIAGTVAGTVRLLAQLRERLGSQGRIVFSTIDPRSRLRDRLYQRRLERQGRYRGEYRFRMEYGGFAGPWFGLVLFEPEVVARLAEDGGWRWIDRAKAGIQEEGVYAGVLVAR